MVEDKDESLQRFTKYDLFRGWSKKVGILGFDNVAYPKEFGNGKNKFHGVVAKKDIKHREAIMAVPYSMLLSVKHISKDLKELMNDCPSLFSTEETTDAEALRLTLFLMSEAKKGLKSGLSPYLDILPKDLTLFYDLGPEILKEVQDEQFYKVVDELRLEVDL